MLNLVRILALILFCSAAQAQVPMTGAGLGKPAGGGGFSPSCTESSNFLVRATGITTTPDKTNYDILICGLVTDGLCCAAIGGVLDALYIFAAPDTTTAKLNLTQNAYNLTQTGSLTFSAAHGFTGDASTGFFDTGFNAQAGSRNFTQNSATIGCYSLTSRTTQQAWAMLGYTGANDDNRIFGLQAAAGGGAIYSVNDNVGINIFTTANAQGSWLVTRTTSTLTTFYKNGASVATSAHTSGLPDNLNIYLFAADGAGSVAAAFNGDQMSACFIGAGMNGTQTGNMQSRLNTFMTAYGINVY